VTPILVLSGGTVKVGVAETDGVHSACTSAAGLVACVAAVHFRVAPRAALYAIAVLAHVLVLGAASYLFFNILKLCCEVFDT
jgi:hypothetical protein